MYNYLCKNASILFDGILNRRRGNLVFASSSEFAGRFQDE